MVVKSQIKLIKSLQQKKYRNETGLFVVEGPKVVRELLDAGFKAYGVYATGPFPLNDALGTVFPVSEKELGLMSGLKNPNGVLGVFFIPETKKVEHADWILALDQVRDPGNLGTIIRLCDWFGIRHLVCSEDTVDCYNPKVLQATMGSISRVNVVYCGLVPFLRGTQMPLYGAFMDGSPVYDEKLPEKGVLVMGNEANGISTEITALIQSKIAIPQFAGRTAESLNVGTATAILLSEIRR